ncbi:PREDICTED: PDZ domain-containing protein MAGIX isoform X2 [Chinchilla lanigera]|uniref:PDZ domain-containing protein MAGIX isoform X2 n=1 Tax=Chinchilla lanigera TaxID=34839 RepID=UPI000698A1F2|nr:PREDICTED: PDZ domain-containing protein MAGIX isoform X2 [Chinchilla lanigera]
MESCARGAEDPAGSRGGHRPQPARPSARRLLSRLDARPLAARAAADVSALVRRAGATLRLRPKEPISALDSADIEVTDSRLPRATVVEHQSQHCRSEALGRSTAPPRVSLDKASYARKVPRASDLFSVELLRGPAGFGLTLSGGRDGAGDDPLAVRGLLKDGPAQRCGRLQVGDLVLCINGESTQGLTHAQVLDRIRAGGPRLRLGLRRPLSKPEELGGPQKQDRSPDPGGPERRSQSINLSPVHHPRSSRTPKARGIPEPSAEAVADGPAVPPPELSPEDSGSHMASSPGPWLVPSEERLSRALGVPGTAQLAQEMAAGRRRH